VVETVVSVVTGYAAYLPAEQLGVSGVLAAVTAGLYVGWRAPEPASAATRLLGFSFWEVVVYLANAVLFIFVGLQLHPILSGLGGTSAAVMVGQAALVSAVVIVVRTAFGFSVPYVIRLLDRRPAQVARRVGPRERLVVGWSGMRGAVSLAAALALPRDAPHGAGARPGRHPSRDLTASRRSSSTHHRRLDRVEGRRRSLRRTVAVRQFGRPPAVGQAPVRRSDRIALIESLVERFGRLQLLQHVADRCDEHHEIVEEADRGHEIGERIQWGQQPHDRAEDHQLRPVRHLTTPHERADAEHEQHEDTDDDDRHHHPVAHAASRLSRPT
jgi:hypothetical protein